MSLRLTKYSKPEASSPKACIWSRAAAYASWGDAAYASWGDSAATRSSCAVCSGTKFTVRSRTAKTVYRAIGLSVRPTRGDINAVGRRGLSARARP